MQESQRLGKDVLRAIEASILTAVVDPEKHKSYCDQASRDIVSFKKLPQRDPRLKTKISIAVNKFETFKTSLDLILKIIDHIVKTGEVIRGGIINFTAPDVNKLFSKIHNLNKQLLPYQREYPNEPNAELDPLRERYRDELRDLEHQANVALSIPFMKNFNEALPPQGAGYRAA